MNDMPFIFSPTELPRKHFINNEYTVSTIHETFSVFNPKDNSLIANDIPIAGEADVDAAVDAAEKAFPHWKKLTTMVRRDILLKFAALIEKHQESLSELTRITLGAPRGTFGKFEVELAAEVSEDLCSTHTLLISKTFKYYAGWIDKFVGESVSQENGFMQITRNEPLGVTAGIVPWNGPMASMGLKAAPALATGNCFILKLSEKTPFASLALGPLIKEAGFPPGVFQILSGDGSTGALLASHMRVRKVSFTGSIATGKKIQEMAAKSNLKRVTLELGGKSPAVFFDDCDLDNAIRWAVNALASNTGQVCFAATRIYVQQGIYPRFVERYKSALEERAKYIGDPEKMETLMGPLVDKAQFERVAGFIERGASQGKLLTGGKRVGEIGCYLEPTVFEGVASDKEIFQQEIFGPVAVLNKFETEDEAIEQANGTEYGLMAGVFTQDINKALRVASEFESGMVGINCVSLSFLTTPFGGSKQSGLGRECGKAALLAFTEPKTIMINLTY